MDRRIHAEIAKAVAAKDAEIARLRGLLAAAGVATEALDGDGDGAIDAGEFLAADTDGDGEVGAAELDRAMVSQLSAARSAAPSHTGE